MTTEYYQIPSQQGLLPLDSSPDPWLASATSTFSSLSFSDNWGAKGSKQALFEPGTADALSWKHIVPATLKGAMQQDVKAAPKVIPRAQFHSTTSKIDAWSVVDNTVPTTKPLTPKLQSPTLKIVQPATLPALPAVVVPHPALAVATPEPTAPVAEEKPIEEELTHQNRYKTELCKSFNETGICRYGVKCQFAHGKEEIRAILRHPKYKTEICKTFHTSGTCPYGIRCRFIHTRSKEESLVAIQKVPQLPVELEGEEDTDDDETFSLSSLSAHPPGIPTPQWSKSWGGMSMAPAPRKNSRASDRLVEPEPAF